MARPVNPDILIQRRTRLHATCPARKGTRVLRWADNNLLDLKWEEIGEHYGRYRLHVPEAEPAMARSLERHGQLSPVVVCRRQERYELIDGFKRLGAARGLAQIPHLSARLMEADERTAKAAIYGLNRAGGRTRELEEAWIIQALVSAGGRVEPGGGGGAVGTAPELGVPPAGADRAVAGGQPGGSVGSDPAGGVVERGTGRHGAPLAGVCRTSPARVSSGASSRSALPGQGSGPGGARSAIERSRKPGMEARRAAAGCAGPHGCVAGAPGAHGADASGSRDLAVPFPKAGAGCRIGGGAEPGFRRRTGARIMRDFTRNEMIRLHYGGASQRRIAKLLGVARRSVAGVLADHEQHRAGVVEVERTRRPRLLDPFADHIEQLRERYPNLTSISFQ